MKTQIIAGACLLIVATAVWAVLQRYQSAAVSDKGIAMTQSENTGPTMKAGASQRDITPPVGEIIYQPPRPSVGVNDPLQLAVLVIEDRLGQRIGIIRFDLLGMNLEQTEAWRKTAKERFGIDHLLLNSSHPHSVPYFTGRSEEDTPHGHWINSVQDKIMEALAEAVDSLGPARLRVGRAETQVGYNRRVMVADGSVIMAPNADGSLVPWVNVLVAERADGSPLAVLFEHAAHPVIVPDTSGLISADYPGGAVVRIRELLGEDVVPLFVQGCGGDVNAYPLRTTHENADKVGRTLGDAVAEAVRTAVLITADEFTVREVTHVDLPSASLPSMEDLAKVRKHLERIQSTEPSDENKGRLDRLAEAEDMVRRGVERGKPRRLDVTAIMLGKEWILVALPHEMFSEYELWVDANAPFEHNMTLAYTNFGQGYIADDASLAMGPKGGYEAGKLPLWWACGALSEWFGPPEVGAEIIIKKAIASLWEE
ncbi:hypothetical protein LCGC14_0124180 [marine sediment metagenome]|uniref:Neutral/alkaline non-lysosomal ceramidase N-terminal domain-containing protein n=1 Tax=marine sediment metagenome TaxID=412755 RepID=A0A0F9Y7P0_9ZZZZ|nr:hypothetical protein [Phycisphaerae bacterium]HDZ42319.1 hypothetical protein [Phycisphaerae bacterium]